MQSTQSRNLKNTKTNQPKIEMQKRIKKSIKRKRKWREGNYIFCERKIWIKWERERERERENNILKKKKQIGRRVIKIKGRGMDRGRKIIR